MVVPLGVSNLHPRQGNIDSVIVGVVHQGPGQQRLRLLEFRLVFQRQGVLLAQADLGGICLLFGSGEEVINPFQQVAQGHGCGEFR